MPCPADFTVCDAHKRATTSAPFAILAAVRDRRSLRKTDLIHAPQHSPSTNEVCQYTPHGFATDLQSRTAAESVSVRATMSAEGMPRGGRVRASDREVRLKEGTVLY